MHAQHNDQSYLNQISRENIVLGYSEIIQEHIDLGWDPFYLNFMFNYIPGSHVTKMDVMRQQVTRVHDILTRHTVKRPQALAWRHLRPIFIGCHDLPVWKHDKELVRNLIVNDGLHFNAIALTPKPARSDMPIKTQYLLWGRQSRLTVPLNHHLWQEQRFYHNDVLSRIHATPIIATPELITDYMLKTFKHGRVGSESIEVWN